MTLHVHPAYCVPRGTCTNNPSLTLAGAKGDTIYCIQHRLTVGDNIAGSCGMQNKPKIDPSNERGRDGTEAGRFWGNEGGLILTRLEFRPRSGMATRNEWDRNQYTLVGTTYYVYLQ